jgi:2-amino-1-hydroxyethylphosphonate dioxygenase (glycine-forming)
MSSKSCANDIICLYKKYGNANYIGEEITQINHMIQCAMLAKQNNENDSMVIALFLHDIGHLLCLENLDLDKHNDLGAKNHETTGSNYLKQCLFPASVYEPINMHANAKRYLVSTDDSYMNNLSLASKQTLKFQGGKMSRKEISEFEEKKYFDEAIALRKYDDKGKQKLIVSGEVEAIFLDDMKKMMTNIIEIN